MDLYKLTIRCGNDDNKRIIHNTLADLIDNSSRYKIVDDINKLIIVCDYKNTNELLDYIGNNLIEIRKLLYLGDKTPILLSIINCNPDFFNSYNFEFNVDFLKKIVSINAGLETVAYQSFRENDITVRTI